MPVHPGEDSEQKGWCLGGFASADFASEAAKEMQRNQSVHPLATK